MDQTRPACRVRLIDSRASDEVELVATRMGLTLAEVLGAVRARALYSQQQLRDRLDWHLVEGRRAAVFVAESGRGQLTGHTIVRVERDLETPREVGLFSTTYVDTGWRRRGVASALLRAGEEWMVKEGMTRSVTYTDVSNHKLRRLFRDHGYDATVLEESWLELSRRI